MLKNVHLKNLALIQEADIDFGPGLNIMTGETGSGKSIIISSINIALGDKANKSIIRTGCDFGLVELQFTSTDPDVFAFLNEQGFSVDDDNIYLTRRITNDSSTARINGQNATLSQIKKLSSLLIDIHGQHDHQSLLNSKNHIGILDLFGYKSIDRIKKEFSDCYYKYKQIKEELSRFDKSDDELNRTIDLLKFQLNEINSANLVVGEDKDLENEYRTLSSREKQSGFLHESSNALSNDDNGAKALIAKALYEINSALLITPEDNELLQLKSSISDIDSAIKDLSHDMNAYTQKNSFDSFRYKEVKDRLNTINILKSKYGNSISDIISFSENVSKQLVEFEQYIKNRTEILNEKNKCRSELNILSQKLSDARHAVADKLSGMITDNLVELNFLNVQFEIMFSKNDKITNNGFDKVEFMISTNPGEAVKPLAQIASGGEISRIMLAIKSSLAEKDKMPTLIFDEIDTGISGLTARMVSYKLHLLSNNHQIICITHLPQIASMADLHFSIHKEVNDGMTITGIERLDSEGSIKEIAGLVGSGTESRAAYENAQELIKQAADYKKEKGC